MLLQCPAKRSTNLVPRFHFSCQLAIQRREPERSCETLHRTSVTAYHSLKFALKEKYANPLYNPAEQRRSWLSSEAYVNDDSPVCLWCDCDRAPCVVSPPLLRSDWVTRHGRAVLHHHYHHHQTGSNDKIIIPAQTGQRSAHLDTAVRSYRWTLDLGQRSGPPCQFYCQQ